MLVHALAVDRVNAVAKGAVGLGGELPIPRVDQAPGHEEEEGADGGVHARRFEGRQPARRQRQVDGAPPVPSVLSRVCPVRLRLMG